jgi:hypothetical protein
MTRLGRPGAGGKEGRPIGAGLSRSYALQKTSTSTSR